MMSIFRSRIPHAKVLAIPAVAMLIGFSLNVIVMGLNNGQMPVLWPGGCDPKAFEDDMVHVCMDATTRLPLLADWIVLNWGVASPGDFFIWFYQAVKYPALLLWAALMVKDHQERKNAG